ncbi:hypothetical protein VTO58DRAFT_110026 [Aureobasidium pullulans]
MLTAKTTNISILKSSPVFIQYPENGEPQPHPSSHHPTGATTDNHERFYTRMTSPNSPGTFAHHTGSHTLPAHKSRTSKLF